MVHFNPQTYQNYLIKEREKFNRRVGKLKVKIGEAEGPMQSWSRPAQKALEQELEVVSVQLGAVEEKLKEFEALLRSKKHSRGVVSPGAVVTVGVDGEEHTFFIVAGSGDLRFGALSSASPVGRALQGKRKGEKARVTFSGKTSEWEILGVE